MRPIIVITLIIGLAACGGQEERPRLAWSQAAVSVGASGSATLQLQIVPSKTLPLPAGSWDVCIFTAGGGPSAAPPTGYTGDPTPRLPICVTVAPDHLSVDVVVSGAGADALAGVWTFRAKGPSNVDDSDLLSVTQTVP